jgi:glutathione peroxidase
MINRRTVFTSALAAVAGPASFRATLAEPAMSRIAAYAFTFSGLTGGDIRLSDYAGRPLLVVNTASLCGYTPQYAGLQQLWSEFHDRGLMIIGVPSNDFGGQRRPRSTNMASPSRSPPRSW